MSDPVRSFDVHLNDGRVWQGAQFTNGFVCVHHPDEINICTIALSTDDLLKDLPEGHPLHQAEIRWHEGAPK